MSSYNSFPDVYAWFLNLPFISHWQSNSMSMAICGKSTTSNQPSLNLKVTRNGQSSICFSIVADFNLSIILWTSKHIKFANHVSSISILSPLLNNIVNDELKYSPSSENSSRIPRIELVNNFKDVVNFSFLTLAFLVNIYDAPIDVRSECLNILYDQLAGSRSREMMKVFVRLLGSDLEEEWMRTMNLAVTNYWISENQDVSSRGTRSSSLFSYGLSTTSGLWKVQAYCPVVSMDIVKSSNPPMSDERLRFSLNHHQLELVIQLNYKVVVRETWVDVIVNIDNIRCDVTRLINESLMKARGAGACEKYFPSRISLQLAPSSLQTSTISISVSKSSENPIREIGIEKSIEGSFEPNSLPGLSVSVSETMTMSLKPWKFEQSVHGNSANLNWFLHDSANGREVFSSKPSKTSMFQPKAWFKHRYSKVYRPFTRQGGVIFAEDEYGENICWKLQKNVMGKSMDWELNVSIWLTYWPNKYKTLYTETRKMGFRETLNLTLS